LVLALLVGSGCSWSGGKPDGPAAITGYVYEDDTGEPIPGALVVLMPSNASLRTRPDGSYLFDNLPRGKYTVRASANGFQDAEKRGVTATPGKVEWAKLFLKRQLEPPAGDDAEN
jgi:hypothetical protein